jgi:hypothetical protein
MHTMIKAKRAFANLKNIFKIVRPQT